MKRVAFYNTYDSTWTLLPLIVIDKSENDEKTGEDLVLGFHFLCFGVTILLKKYD